MRVLIDARMIHIGGTLTVATNLVDALVRNHQREVELFVLQTSQQPRPELDRSQLLFTSTNNPLVWLASDYTQIPRLIRRLRPDIFHSLRRPMLRPVIGAASIITIHAAYAYFHPEFQSIAERIYWTPRMRSAARKADLVISVSETEKANISEAFEIPLERIRTVYNAADAMFAEPQTAEARERVARRYDLPGKFVLFAGNAYRYKNLPNILRSFDRLCSETDLPHDFVWIGGTGVAERDVANALRQIANRDRIRRIGPVPRVDVPAFFDLADLFLFPTIYDAFGIPVIEAMSSGTPVIISNRAALPEVAGGAAIEANPDDVDHIASRMKDVLTNPELYEQLVASGLRRSRDFSWDESARKLVSIYREILGA